MFLSTLCMFLTYTICTASQCDIDTTNSCTIRGRPNIPCTVESNSTVCRHVGGLYGESWPGKPTDLEVSVYRKEYNVGSGKEYHGLNFTWGIPKDDSFYKLTGFQLILTYLSPPSMMNKQICRYFNLSSAGWNIKDLHDKVKFSYSCLYPIMEATFYVQLYSLPKPSPEYQIMDQFAALFITTPKYEIAPDSLRPADWIGYMVFTNDTANNQVQVSFSFAPEKYGFQHYEVMLVKNDTINTLVEKIDVRKYEIGHANPKVTFEKVKSGKYMIWLQPHDHAKDNINECVCYRVQHQSSRECINCAVTRSSVFTMGNTNLATGTVKTSSLVLSTIGEALPNTSIFRTWTTGNPKAGTWEEPHVENEATGTPKVVPVIGDDKPVLEGDKVAGIAIASILAILLILLSIIIAAVIQKRRTRPPDDHPDPKEVKINPSDPPPNEPGKQVRVKELEHLTKRVFIVYSSDHPMHERVVNTFALFLQKHCACNVRIDLWCMKDIHRDSKMGWIISEIRNADKIVIITSEGAFKKYEARGQKKTYKQMDDNVPVGDTFTPTFCQIIEEYSNTQDHSKYMMARFDYTSKCFELNTNVHPNMCYKLMTNLESLVLHIHGYEQYDNGVKQCIDKINSTEYDLLPHGKILDEAIKNMSKMVKENEKWFDQMYGEPSGEQEHFQYQDTEEPFDSGIDSIPYKELVVNVSLPTPPSDQADTPPSADSFYGLPRKPEDMLKPPYTFPPCDWGDEFIPPKDYNSYGQYSYDNFAADHQDFVQPSSAPASPITFDQDEASFIHDFIPPRIPGDDNHSTTTSTVIRNINAPYLPTISDVVENQQQHMLNSANSLDCSSIHSIEI